MTAAEQTLAAASIAADDWPLTRVSFAESVDAQKVVGNCVECICLRHWTCFRLCTPAQLICRLVEDATQE